MKRKKIHIRPERLGISVFLVVVWLHIFNVLEEIEFFCFGECLSMSPLIHGMWAAMGTLGVLFGLIGLYFWGKWVFVKCNGGG